MRVGADEAGRGPVLGAMFVAAVAAPAPGALPDGIRDSKALSAARREAFATALRADGRIAIAVAEVAVDRIDDPATDMTTLSVEAMGRAIGAVAEPGDDVVVDAGEVDADRFARRVTDHAPVDDVTAAHRADETVPVVSAASVVAKVARDAHVSDLERTYGAVGSGYPSDPTTRSFLRDYVGEHGGLPGCARRSWRTAEDVLSAAAQSALEEF